MNDRVRDRSFVAKRHRDLLDGPFVADLGLRDVQERFRRESGLAERRALSREFERVLEQLPEQTVLEAVRGMSFAVFAERFLRHPKGHTAGEAFRLEPWQRRFDDEFGLLDADGRRLYGTGFLGIPRGNGKTALAAAIAVYELLCRSDEPDVFFAASSKRQAEIAFGFAKSFVRSSPELRDVVVVQKHELIVPETGGSMTVLPATGATAYGLAPSVAIVDELHVWGRDAQLELWEALRTGAQKAKNGFVLGISTAAGNPDSLLATLLEHELAKPTVERPHDCLAIGKDRVAGTLTWWYGAPENADLDDEALWRRCNPASFVSLRDLRRQRLAPGISDDAFAKLHLNRPGVGAEEQLISDAMWNRCVDPKLVPPEGATVHVGVESSFGGRTVAIAILWRSPGGRVVVATHVMATPDEPTAAHERIPEWRERVDVTHVAEWIRDIPADFRVRSLVFDGIELRLKPMQLRELGLSLNITNVRSGSSVQKESSRRLFSMIENGEIAHKGDPVLEAHICGTRGIWDRDQRLNVYKRDQAKQITAWYAICQALSQMPETASVYEERGVLGV